MNEINLFIQVVFQFAKKNWNPKQKKCLQIAQTHSPIASFSHHHDQYGSRTADG